jgi:hypothetical protein
MDRSDGREEQGGSQASASHPRYVWRSDTNDDQNVVEHSGSWAILSGERPGTDHGSSLA